MYSIETIGSITGASWIRKASGTQIVHLVCDSRRVPNPSASLFFALVTDHNDGHRFLTDAWRKGVRNFVVSRDVDAEALEGSNLLQVPDTLAALQKLAAYHRAQFGFPVIGITGSNGKTTVKEWLFQLLQDEYDIVRSPRSYNSQIGVPLSVWAMSAQHTLGLFEAGISKMGEMERLEAIIRPQIGVFTNLGEAHSDGFAGAEEKMKEKILLFRDAEVLIYPGDDLLVREAFAALPKEKKVRVVRWGLGEHNELRVRESSRNTGGTRIVADYEGEELAFELPFTDAASLENVLTCCALMLALGYQAPTIATRLQRLHPIDMRLQLVHSNNGCLVVNDSYSADLTSLRMALDFQKQQAAGLTPVVILSEFAESGRSDEELYRSIAGLLRSYGIRRVIAIGEKAAEYLGRELEDELSFASYPSTADFIRSFPATQFYREIVLVKGARRFGFERIVPLFERKRHQTVLEIDLNALAHNLKEYQRLLHTGTRVMAMVKAFSYGSGGAEIASVLQFHHTAYLGVAYADEGVDLVRAGITLPIMVMNAEPSSFPALVDEGLQPVLYSPAIALEFGTYLKAQGIGTYPVHIEIETGMNRLGFSVDEAEELAIQVAASGLFSIQSVFTHLAASEDPSQDDFTREQAVRFGEGVARIRKHVQAPFLQHIANSAAIVRHRNLQLDMVRLGIGLYGVEVDSDGLLDLKAVATLRSTVAQVHRVRSGESVSYNRRGRVSRDSLIATVRIGYADGYARRFSNGVGKMWVRGQLAPVIGTVCMDMTMIDVTDIPGVREGDDVVIFGTALPVQQVASWIGTIPYELMTGVSQRVKRVYFHE